LYRIRITKKVKKLNMNFTLKANKLDNTLNLKVNNNIINLPCFITFENIPVKQLMMVVYYLHSLFMTDKFF